MNALTLPRYPTPASDADLDALLADLDAADRRAVFGRYVEGKVASHRAAPHPRALRVTDPAYLCFGCDTGRHDERAFCVSCGEETDAYPAGVMS